MKVNFKHDERVLILPAGRIKETKSSPIPDAQLVELEENNTRCFVKEENLLSLYNKEFLGKLKKALKK